MKYYEMIHVISFEDTNLVGNVYYANYIKWQGRCREMFLHDYAPEIVSELQNQLKLFTIKCECEFFSELAVFDEVTIRMSLTDITQSQIEFSFDYIIKTENPARYVAKGKQRIACMSGENKNTHPIRVPQSLLKALKPYIEDSKLATSLHLT